MFAWTDTQLVVPQGLLDNPASSDVALQMPVRPRWQNQPKPSKNRLFASHLVGRPELSDLTTTRQLESVSRSLLPSGECARR